MSSGATQPRYMLDASDTDLRRLLGIAEVCAPAARAAFDRIGVGPGWRVLDCGCGPLGALAILSEQVGATGKVLGLDFSEPTVQQARANSAALGLANVEVRVANVHDLSAEALGGPVDLAFTRAFLMHQPDPGATLASIARVVRPGGWIVCHEPMASPLPEARPHLPALADYWRLVQRLAEALGVPRDSIGTLAETAVRAGLEVVEHQGFFVPMAPAQGLDIHVATLTSVRERAIASGAAAGEEVDAIVAALRAADPAHLAWVGTPVHLGLVLRVAASGHRHETSPRTASGARSP